MQTLGQSWDCRGKKSRSLLGSVRDNESMAQVLRCGGIMQKIGIGTVVRLTLYDNLLGIISQIWWDDDNDVVVAIVTTPSGEKYVEYEDIEVIAG